MNTTAAMADTAADLERAARAVIVSRFGRFAAGCVLPMLVWTVSLAYANPGNRTPAALTLGFQALVLAIAWRRCHRDPARVHGGAIVAATTLVLTLSTIVLFTAAGSTGEVLGFVLFTMCVMAALVFPWGWEWETGLTAAVLGLYACAFPWLRFALAPVELTPVIGIAAVLCVAIAEGHAQNFRATLRRRWSEEEALRALAASRDTYRDITENARDLIWATDLDGRLTYVNEAGARVLGFAPAEILGRNVDQSIMPHPEEGTPAEMRAHLGAGATLPPTVLECHTVKGPTWVEMIAYAVRDADGTVIGFRGISRDVTARRQAETALRESEARYRGLVESQDALIYRADLAGKLTFLNEACRGKYGVAHIPLTHLSFLTFVHPDDAPQAMAALAAVAAGGRYRRTSRGRTPAGWRWIEWEVCAIADGNGVVTEVQGVGHDVTEKRAADEALQRSLDALREREEQLRLMALRQAAIREEERKRLGFDLHDGVCQELVGIGILIESARQRGVTKEAGTTLTRAQTYLRAVGEHLRLLARELRPLQLLDLGLGECLRALATGMATAQVRITVAGPTEIPRLGEEIEVAVYRVAQEALANAVRHAQARNVALTLATSGEMLALEVRDDGVGFERATLRSAALGLVAMEERAIALGGRLSVQSAPGTGTTVRLECPLGGSTTSARTSSASASWRESR
jgi:PAS domain S-box-containing protein